MRPASNSRTPPPSASFGGLARAAVDEGAAGAAAILIAALLGCSSAQTHSVLILARAGDPISEAIAREYAEARGVPEERVLALEIADASTEQIGLEEYLRTIAEPLETYLARVDPGAEITTIVTTRGIPLQIGSCPTRGDSFPRSCHAAALDAVLAGLGRLALESGTEESSGTDRDPLELGSAPNPYFGDERSFEAFRRDEPDSPLRFLVSRLTAPLDALDPGTGIPRAVHGMIEGDRGNEMPRAARGEGPAEAPSFRWEILAEGPVDRRTAAARALLDPIGLRLAPFAHHSICDGCEQDATGDDAARLTGIVLARSVSPRTALSSMRLRLTRPGLVLDLVGAGSLPGDSPSAERAAFEARLGGWLAGGATLVSTHLADPSLAGVARPDFALEALARGRTMAEAHFRSLPHLGWMNVLIGDPLVTLPRPSIEGREGEPTETLVARERDTDGDGIPDAEDNCRLHHNPAQRDSDEDGIGNRCDPDVDNNGRVETSWGHIYPRPRRGDLEAIALTIRSGRHDANHDLDGDGRVDENDLALAQLWLFRPPGPSGRLESEREAAKRGWAFGH